MTRTNNHRNKYMYMLKPIFSSFLKKPSVSNANSQCMHRDLTKYMQMILSLKFKKEFNSKRKKCTLM